MPHQRSVTKQDTNHDEVYKALKDRCAGYWRDKELGHHYAHLRGLKICAYDTHKIGNGFPDWEVWVSWLCMQFEVKQQRELTRKPGETRGRKATLNDDFYRAQLEKTELTYRISHSSIIPIVYDRDEVFEWIKAMTDFVFYVEEKAEGSNELLALFFPKAMKIKQMIGE